MYFLSLSLSRREHYRFVCGCPACDGDYPTLAAARPLTLRPDVREERGCREEEAEELAARDLFVDLKERYRLPRPFQRAKYRDLQKGVAVC